MSIWSTSFIPLRLGHPLDPIPFVMVLALPCCNMETVLLNHLGSLQKINCYFDKIIVTRIAPQFCGLVQRKRAEN